MVNGCGGVWGVSAGGRGRVSKQLRSREESRDERRKQMQWRGGRRLFVTRLKVTRSSWCCACDLFQEAVVENSFDSTFTHILVSYGTNARKMFYLRHYLSSVSVLLA